MRSAKKHWEILGTLLFDLFLLWVILRFGLGGWESAARLLPSQGPMVWAEVSVMVFLTLIRSNFRNDIPLFLAALLLAYWGEWWGTSRGFWKYAGRDGLPLYVVFTWGVCLLTVYHLYLLFRGQQKEGQQKEGKEGKRSLQIKILTLLALPAVALAFSWEEMAKIDWMKHVDAHLIGGLLVGALLILKDFDLRETFWIFLSGTLLGGFYEFMGTSTGNWKYVTGEGLPLLIAPVWGFLCVAMIKLGFYLKRGSAILFRFLRSRLSSLA